MITFPETLIIYKIKKFILKSKFKISLKIFLILFLIKERGGFEPPVPLNGTTD